MPSESLYLRFWLAGWLQASDTRSCKPGVNAEENGLTSINGKPVGPALIFGDKSTVPTIYMRFVDLRTGLSLRPIEVALAYGWRWIQYPYPEHPTGAWSEASDMVSCRPTESDMIEIPSFEVRPRGWYDGKYAKFPFARKPSFTGIDVTATFDECTARVTIKPGDLTRLQGHTAVVTVNCHGKSALTFEP